MAEALAEPPPKGSSYSRRWPEWSQKVPAISSVQPGFTFPGMSVEVIGNTGSCNRAGTLTFHGMTGDVSVKVTADQQGNFVARITIPKGTFPRAYELELTVDCNGQLQRA